MWIREIHYCYVLQALCMYIYKSIPLDHHHIPIKKQNERTMAMALLPRFVVLQSKLGAGGNYLRVVTEKLPTWMPSGFLRFDETNIWSPLVKFEVEPAQTGNGKFVHIRSCYNNKYLMATEINIDDGSHWIIASSNKPEEDRSKASCTLFEPFGDPYNLHLLVVHSGSLIEDYVIQGGQVTDTTHGLLVKGNRWDPLTCFHAIDWEKLVILPSEVTFRSEDDKYICSCDDSDISNQKFQSDLDVGDPLAAKVLFPTPDGNYRIWDSHFGKFWRIDNRWIHAEADENDYSDSTKFSIIKISDNVVALLNLGNNNFCGPVTMYDGTHLMASYPTISKKTRLVVEERVLERDISEVQYRLSDSRIYDETIEEVSHAFATNESSVEKASISLTYSTSDSRTSRWTNSMSVNVGVSVKFNTTIVPFIASSEMQLKASIGYEHVWDDSIATEQKRESSYVVVVPPLTTMKVTLMCTKAACDVPFYYTQRDLLTSGKRVKTIKDNGIYTGINSYNFYFQSTEVEKDDKGRIFLGN